VYDLSKAQLNDVLEKSDSFRRGNDPRLQHFVGVEPTHVREQILPAVLPEVAQ
jgi:CRISPR-associated protein Csc1